MGISGCALRQSHHARSSYIVRHFIITDDDSPQLEHIDTGLLCPLIHRCFLVYNKDACPSPVPHSGRRPLRRSSSSPSTTSPRPSSAVPTSAS